MACGLFVVWAVSTVSPVIAANQVLYHRLDLVFHFLCSLTKFCKCYAKLKHSSFPISHGNNLHYTSEKPQNVDHFLHEQVGRMHSNTICTAL